MPEAWPTVFNTYWLQYKADSIVSESQRSSGTGAQLASRAASETEQMSESVRATALHVQELVAPVLPHQLDPHRTSFPTSPVKPTC